MLLVLGVPLVLFDGVPDVLVLGVPDVLVDGLWLNWLGVGDPVDGVPEVEPDGDSLCWLGVGVWLGVLVWLYDGLGFGVLVWLGLLLGVWLGFLVVVSVLGLLLWVGCGDGVPWLPPANASPAPPMISTAEAAVTASDRVMVMGSL